MFCSLSGYHIRQLLSHARRAVSACDYRTPLTVILSGGLYTVKTGEGREGDESGDFESRFVREVGDDISPSTFIDASALLFIVDGLC